MTEPAAETSIPDPETAPGPAGPHASRVAAASSWEPHEVWLTRVKQPRDQAARRSEGDAGDVAGR